MSYLKSSKLKFGIYTQKQKDMLLRAVDDFHAVQAEFIELRKAYKRHVAKDDLAPDVLEQLKEVEADMEVHEAVMVALADALDVKIS